MGSLGSLAIGLSVVFVGFLMVLLAELYYLMYWRRKNRGITSRRSGRNGEVGLLDENRREDDQDDDEEEDEQELREVNVIANRHQSFQCELSSTKLFPISSEALDHSHYLMGPSRFLFTIREETKEELESEILNRSRNASLDLAMLQPAIFSEPETPFVTPPSSPSLFSTPQGTPSPSPSPSIRALAREPPMHCAIFIPSPQRGFPAASSGASPGSRRLHSPCSSRTTMMMMLLNGSPPASPNSPAVYRTPPTHLLGKHIPFV